MFPNAGTWVIPSKEGEISITWMDKPGIYKFKYAKGETVLLSGEGSAFDISLHITYYQLVIHV
jgi:hypothetical protein